MRAVFRIVWGAWFGAVILTTNIASTAFGAAGSART
jgi:hypothetical protein